MTPDTLITILRREIKENVNISIPLMASQLVYACSGFLATAMVARLGEDALAASILVNMPWACFTMLFFGILNAVCVLISHQVGAQTFDKISPIMGQSFLLGLLLMVFLALLLLALPPLMHWSHQPLNVQQLANQYVYAMLWTVPGLIFVVILEHFLAGINQAKLILKISFLIVPLEIFLIYAFIFGRWGFPVCGIAGVGYGFSVTYTLTVISLGFYLATSKRFSDFQIFSHIHFKHWHYFRELLRIGLPMGMMHVIEISAFLLATFWIAQFSTTALAAHQLVMQYLAFIITIVFAMSQAVTIRVGQTAGRKDLQRISYAAYTGMSISFIFILIIAIALMSIPTFFLRLDLNIHTASTADLVKEAALLLSICGMLIIFDNFRLVCFGALRALKDTRFPMYTSLVSFWMVGIGSAYWLGFICHQQAAGIWRGLMIGVVFGAILVLLRLNYLLKRVDLNKIIAIPSHSKDDT